MLTSRRNSSENNFPEQGKEVHDIVSTSWHLLLTLFSFFSTFFFLFIIIAYTVQKLFWIKNMKCGQCFQFNSKLCFKLTSNLLPAWTVKASTNWSFQEEAPTIMLALPRLSILSTELCKKIFRGLTHILIKYI